MSYINFLEIYFIFFFIIILSLDWLGRKLRKQKRVKKIISINETIPLLSHNDLKYVNVVKKDLENK